MVGVPYEEEAFVALWLLFDEAADPKSPTNCRWSATSGVVIVTRETFWSQPRTVESVATVDC